MRWPPQTGSEGPGFPGAPEVGRGWGHYIPPPTMWTQTLQRDRGRESVCCSTEQLPPAPLEPPLPFHIFGFFSHSVLLSPGAEGTKMS